MADAQRIVIPYTPRKAFAPYHNRDKRWTVIVAHRRAGKTVSCVNELLKCALSNTRANPPPRYAYIAPHYNQAKDVAWEYLKKYAAPVLQYGGSINESELRVDLPNGARVRLYGADNADRLRGLYFDGVILDEFADMDPRVWEVIRPTLSDHAGWCTWIGTPKGHNEFFKIWQGKEGDDPAEWLKLMLRASETGLLDPKELESSKRGLTPEQYAQEYECSFEAAIQGAYYGKEMAEAEASKRIARVPYDKATDVITAWDLGIGDSTAIWFCQQIGQEYHLIDYLENNGVGLDWYVKELKAKPYNYGDHILPHDVEAKELGTGKSRKEVLGELGLKSIVVAPRLGVDDGISAVRMVFNRCWFDKENCARGIEALKQYRTDWDDRLKVFKNRPLHDWTSHPADAFRYLFTGIRKTDKAQWSDQVMNFNVDWVA